MCVNVRVHVYVCVRMYVRMYGCSAAHRPSLSTAFLSHSLPPPSFSLPPSRPLVGDEGHTCVSATMTATRLPSGRVRTKGLLQIHMPTVSRSIPWRQWKPSALCMLLAEPQSSCGAFAAVCIKVSERAR